MHDVRVLYGRCSDRVRDVLTPLGIVVTEPLLAVNPCQNKSGSNGQQSDHVTGWPAVLMFFCITGIKKDHSGSNRWRLSLPICASLLPLWSYAPTDVAWSSKDGVIRFAVPVELGIIIPVPNLCKQRLGFL